MNKRQLLLTGALLLSGSVCWAWNECFENNTDCIDLSKRTIVDFQKGVVTGVEFKDPKDDCKFHGRIKAVVEVGEQLQKVDAHILPGFTHCFDGETEMDCTDVKEDDVVTYLRVFFKTANLPRTKQGVIGCLQICSQ